MKHIVKKGQTSYLAVIFIQDSSSATGAGLTGLTSGSAGLVCYRARADDGNAAGTQITISGGTRGTWSSGGFVEKDATNMPGVYELGIPDAALATGSSYAIVMLKGATNMAPLPMEFQLVGFDPLDAVHLGLSSLPNTAVTTNASLLTSGTGTDQLSVTSGRIDIGKALGTAVTLDANNVLNVSTKYVSGTLQTARDLGASVTQTGDAYARLGAPVGASTSADIAALKTDLDAGVALTVSERNSTANALLDLSAGVETGLTLRQAARVMVAALAGKASGLATTTAKFRDTNDSKDRITATVDTSGNRTSVTLNTA